MTVWLYGGQYYFAFNPTKWGMKHWDTIQNVQGPGLPRNGAVFPLLRSWRTVWRPHSWSFLLHSYQDHQCLASLSFLLWIIPVGVLNPTREDQSGLNFQIPAVSMSENAVVSSRSEYLNYQVININNDNNCTWCTVQSSPHVSPITFTTAYKVGAIISILKNRKLKPMEVKKFADISS